MRRIVHNFAITLPLPPSMNSYWKINRMGMIYVSTKGKLYRKTLQQLIKLDRPFRDELCVTAVYYKRDNRKSDLDNYLKPLLDACTHAGLWADDSQVRDLRIVDSGEMVPGGAIFLQVTSLLRDEPIPSSPPKKPPIPKRLYANAHSKQTSA